MENTEIVTMNNDIDTQEKAIVDMQVSTAHAYPRDVMKAKNNAVAIMTMDLTTAKTASYALPRGGKTITGATVHLARVLAQSWGNLRVEAKIIGSTPTHVISRAVCWDLETNVAVSMEVRRSIIDKNGRKFNMDMQTVTGNSANAISFRNAVFAVIPRAVTDAVYNAARNMITGDLTDEQQLIKRRKQMLDYFLDTYGVTEQQILDLLNFNSINQIKQDQIVHLIGVQQGIKDGDVTVAETFKKKAVKKENVGKSASERLKETLDEKVPPRVNIDAISDKDTREVELKNMGAEIFKLFDEKFPQVPINTFAAGVGQKKTNKMCREIILSQEFGKNASGFIADKYKMTAEDILAKGKDKLEPEKFVRSGEQQMLLLQELGGKEIDNDMLQAYSEKSDNRFTSSNDIITTATDVEIEEICNSIK